MTTFLPKLKSNSTIWSRKQLANPKMPNIKGDENAQQTPLLGQYTALTEAAAFTAGLAFKFRSAS